MTDEFAIRKIAQELIGLYEALEERKHSPEKYLVMATSHGIIEHESGPLRMRQHPHGPNPPNTIEECDGLCLRIPVLKMNSGYQSSDTRAATRYPATVGSAASTV